MGKNKEALIDAAENAMSGIELIKIRNYILETQSFALANELWWNFLTNILQIQQDNVFKMWEEARTI
ncbi:hypothetical protein [Snodgrassella communis]|uniref:hypothetical protein n=1 Tax=Snodgrassella communis TaxID=2946699 RepID=UPI001EF4C329|nr:hypothetical protein [Snodgrassella communis]